MSDANTIFVFGSNLRGIHGAGAAKIARFTYGAVLGIGRGRTGNAYAIPTKTAPTRGDADACPIVDIARDVTEFLVYARAHPELSFLVSAIGCGLAGFAPQEIAPLFRGAPDNVKLPLAFHHDAFGQTIENRVSFRF